MNIEKICEDIYKRAKKIHDALGGGFNEAVHQNALAIEFRKAGIPYLKEVNIEIFYDGHSVGTDRPDFVVLPTQKLQWELAEPLVIEIKVAPRFTDDNRQQLKTYLKSLPQNRNSQISKARAGLLLRFSKGDIYPDDEDRPQLPKHPVVEIEAWGFSPRGAKMKRLCRRSE